MSSNTDQEKRTHYRKKVSLAGEFMSSTTDEFGEMLVEDLSFYGIRFAPLQPHNLVVGDILTLRFRLDDAKRTEIKKRAEVRTVKDREVGAQFLQGVSMDKDLGFYLLK